MGRHVQLWGGPMDGATVFVGDGELPARVGMHRTADDYLVPIRTRALQGPLEGDLAAMYTHVQVYEHVTIDVLRAWRAQVGSRAVLFDTAGRQRLEDVPVYVHRELVTRWLSQAGM